MNEAKDLYIYQMQKAVSKMLPHSSVANCIYLCGCIQTSVLCNKTQMTCFTIMKCLFLFKLLNRFSTVHVSLCHL
jgi:hypothetical protein